MYTIATFPFLFAVMFGDAGHGTIMLLFAIWMILQVMWSGPDGCCSILTSALNNLQEKKLEKHVDSSEIFKIFFGGRYIIFMMSVGAIYTGLIYNDIFSKSFNIFGSHFKIPFNFTASEGNPIVLGDSIGLDPKFKDQYEGVPYPFGVDPVWLIGMT